MTMKWESIRLDGMLAETIVRQRDIVTILTKKTNNEWEIPYVSES